MEKEIHNLYNKSIDSLIQARYVLWSSIITVNGIIISSFAIIASVTQSPNKTIVYFIFGLSFMAIFLLIINIIIMQLGSCMAINFIQATNGISTTQEMSKAENKAKKNQRKTNRYAFVLKYFEIISEITTLVSIGIIFRYVYTIIP